jgi:hypothetical protein
MILNPAWKENYNLFVTLSEIVKIHHENFPRHNIKAFCRRFCEQMLYTKSKDGWNHLYIEHNAGAKCGFCDEPFSLSQYPKANLPLPIIIKVNKSQTQMLLLTLFLYSSNKLLLSLYQT